MKKLKTAYLLDPNNTILSVDGSWDQFAIENDGTDMLANNVCGRSIWEFVAGDATRMWLDTVFQLVRVNSATIERPYRCDSPELKRYMKMSILPEQGGVLRIVHDVLETEECVSPIHFTCDLRTDSKNLRIRCSICGRLKYGDYWEEPCHNQDLQRKHIRVAYSVCGDCRQSVL